MRGPGQGGPREAQATAPVPAAKPRKEVSLATKVPGYRSLMFKRTDVEGWKARLEPARNTLKLKTG